jgi:hypothetical protein
MTNPTAVEALSRERENIRSKERDVSKEVSTIWFLLIRERWKDIVQITVVSSQCFPLETNPKSTRLSFLTSFMNIGIVFIVRIISHVRNTIDI